MLQPAGFQKSKNWSGRHRHGERAAGCGAADQVAPVSAVAQSAQEGAAAPDFADFPWGAGFAPTYFDWRAFRRRGVQQLGGGHCTLFALPPDEAFQQRMNATLE